MTIRSTPARSFGETPIASSLKRPVSRESLCPTVSTTTVGCSAISLAMKWG